MAGRIRDEDVERVRERARIDEIAGEHVTLKVAGGDSMKGLCPFHDEKTPSFHVRPSAGLFYCFGCGKGGDVITFVRETMQLGFVEAVEYLADRYGIDLHYEEARGRSEQTASHRQTIIQANDAAQRYFAEQLMTAEAMPAKQFLAERGFDAAIAQDYGLGYAPEGWDGLATHLRKQGFTEDQLRVSGLFGQNRRGGLYDRLRGRLMFPIRDQTGVVIGFGARKLSEDDEGPKYLNTPETEVYKKSRALYGIDRARREIAKQRQVVIVEGYTDVMAAHLAGIPTAVATCGTAFSSEHATLVRRLIGDSADPAAGVVLSSGVARGGEVIFTFDGDAAGQNAALKAFGADQSFAAQTFVAIEPSGLDPCEVRLSRGDEALRQLIRTRKPLFAFVLRTILSGWNLDTAEGRVSALREAAPVVAGIRDRALRAEYRRLLAGWVGMPMGEVEAAVRQAERAPRRAPAARPPAPAGPVPRPMPNPPAGEDPVVRLERNCLEAIIQYPGEAEGMGFDQLDGQAFMVPMHRCVHDAIRAVGGFARFGELRASAESALGVGPAAIQAAQRRWVEEIRQAGGGLVDGTVLALAMTPLPLDDATRRGAYVRDIVRAMARMSLTRTEGELNAKLARLEPGSDEYRATLAALVEASARKRALAQG